MLVCSDNFRVAASFLWIPVTPVITAIGCDDWGDENDGAEAVLAT